MVYFILGLSFHAYPSPLPILLFSEGVYIVNIVFIQEVQQHFPTFAFVAIFVCTLKARFHFPLF